MSAGVITALCTGIPSVIASIIALVHAIQAKNTGYNASIVAYGAKAAIGTHLAAHEGAPELSAGLVKAHLTTHTVGMNPPKEGV